MSKEPEVKEGISNPFGEENSSDTGRNMSECITDTVDDQVLEKGGISREWRLFPLVRVTPFTY